MLSPAERRGAGRVVRPVGEKAAVDGEHQGVALVDALDQIDAGGEQDEANGEAEDRQELPRHGEHHQPAADHDAHRLALAAGHGGRPDKRLGYLDGRRHQITAPATPMAERKVTTPPTTQAPMMTRAMVCSMPSS